MIKNAIISCHDKTGIKEFAAELAKKNPDVKIFSSSGTAKAVAEAAKENVVEISSYTGFPEMPGGLVKTLHPKIHAGILADVNNSEHRKYLEDNGIAAFDLVAVNLYPFEKTVAQGADLETARQNIDIGGVALIEAAAKNFRKVAVVVDPADYHRVLEENSDKLRMELAKKALAHIAAYLESISEYFSKQE